MDIYINLAKAEIDNTIRYYVLLITNKRYGSFHC